MLVYGRYLCATYLKILFSTRKHFWVCKVGICSAIETCFDAITSRLRIYSVLVRLLGIYAVYASLFRLYFFTCYSLFNCVYF